MDTPLKRYLDARSALDKGLRELAAMRLAGALGYVKPTEYMRQNIDKLLDGEVVSTVLLTHNLKKQAKGED